MQSFFKEISWKNFRDKNPGIGIVIHGPQGSGKSTMAKTIAQEYDSFWTYNFDQFAKQFEECCSMANWGIQVIIVDAVTDTESLMNLTEGMAQYNALFIFCIQGEPGPALGGPFVFIDAVSHVVTCSEDALPKEFSFFGLIKSWDMGDALVPQHIYTESESEKEVKNG